ncbi:MAG: GAF domain-containing protein, partial [Candidatus Sumerlaeota bacterium]|nr:GAF domain-containing protein [Candidatus Sumerlaeota bacterium]
MPGVKQREFMRGPTDRLLFQWDTPSKEHQNSGVWLENRSAYKKYLDDLKEEFLRQTTRKPLPEQGMFSDREKPEATAKLCLWKGLDQTNDGVGQIFFNFSKDNPERDIFTDSLKEIIRDVCVLVRELLIDDIYHEDPDASRAKKDAPDRLLHEVSQLFATRQETDPGPLHHLESHVASAICDMVRTVTENISGQVDLVLLDERSLAKIYGLDSQGKKPDLRIIESGSVTGQCIADRKYVLVNDTAKSSVKVKEDLDRFQEFNQISCKSFLMVPIAHEGEVRAVVRLTNPWGGFFLDAHAKVMQKIELVILQCLLRVVEHGQRQRMSSALEFYTASQSLPGERFWSLLTRLPKAFGATWGTYWPRVRVQDGEFQAPEGVKFTPESVTAPSDECDIRTGSFEPGCVVGLSHLLYDLNSRESVFLCLHVLQNGAKAKYLLRFYSHGTLTPITHAAPTAERVLTDKFHLSEFTETQNLPWCSGLYALNPNTSKSIHTRVAFVVREKQAIKGIVWLKFDDIHNLDWWERSYIDGLS